MAGRPVPPVHIVTDDAVLSRERFHQQAEALLRVGGPDVALYLRGHSTLTRVLYERADELAPVADAVGALLLVNDRLDVALATGAAGVQIGRRSVPAAEARRLLGPDRYLGVSVHNLDEVEDALTGAPDLLVVGTLYPTASHPEERGAGPEVLEHYAAFGVPLIGIGGISPERVGVVRSAGAEGVAVLRGVWDAADPVHALKVYLQEWRNLQ